MQARRGRAEPGRAWQGKARQAWRGQARPGTAEHGEARQARHGTAGRGEAWHGAARQCRRGEVRLGPARQSLARQCRRGEARHGKAEQCRQPFFLRRNKVTTKAELEIIRGQNSGILRPKDVVNFARDESTALHSHFEWNDDVAAVQFRLEQARRIVRFTVVVLPNHNKSTHAYVSLTSDRQNGDSYRHIADVMADPLARQHLLRQALDEVESWRQRHADLVELNEVFQAIDAQKNVA